MVAEDKEAEEKKQKHASDATILPTLNLIITLWTSFP